MQNKKRKPRVNLRAYRELVLLMCQLNTLESLRGLEVPYTDHTGTVVILFKLKYQDLYAVHGSNAILRNIKVRGELTMKGIDAPYRLFVDCGTLPLGIVSTVFNRIGGPLDTLDVPDNLPTAPYVGLKDSTADFDFSHAYNKICITAQQFNASKHILHSDDTIFPSFTNRLAMLNNVENYEKLSLCDNDKRVDFKDLYNKVFFSTVKNTPGVAYKHGVSGGIYVYIDGKFIVCDTSEYTFINQTNINKEGEENG